MTQRESIAQNESYLDTLTYLVLYLYREALDSQTSLLNSRNTKQKLERFLYPRTTVLLERNTYQYEGLTKSQLENHHTIY